MLRPNRLDALGMETKNRNTVEFEGMSLASEYRHMRAQELRTQELAAANPNLSGM
jgi:hypothetical protein